MFILYPEYAMTTIIPGGKKYILRKGDDVILNVEGKDFHYTTYDITKNKEVIFKLSWKNTKDALKNDKIIQLKFGSEDLNMLANMLYNVGVNSVIIETTWVLYSVEAQSYYRIGDVLDVSSRRLNLTNKRVIFKEAHIENNGATIILEDDLSEYKLVNSSYNGNTYMEDIFSGIPFYSDIHCEAKTSASLFGMC